MFDLKINYNKYQRCVQDLNTFHEVGQVTDVSGAMITGFVPGATVGSVCEIFPQQQGPSFLAEVVGFHDQRVLLMPLGVMEGVGLGSKITLSYAKASAKLGPELMGRVLDGLGNPIDDIHEIDWTEEAPIYRETMNPLKKPPIKKTLSLGVRAIDGLITLGRGQRVGIMAGSGVGKSILLGMMARSSEADVNVIALIGERGREVREFIENNLGKEGLRKSIVIVATSDQSPLIRMRGAFLATTIAEYFSSRGQEVLLMMDSLTRFAMAQREVGLSVGEPPATKGYTPSVFSLLPKLLERVGTFEGQGSITGLYSVLVEGDDMDDPIADAVRSTVDGHIVLSRELAEKAHFPAIDVLKSISRVMINVAEPSHVQASQFIRKNLAVYKEAEDLINIGAYKQGSSPAIDQSIAVHGSILSYLQQNKDESSDYLESIQLLRQIAEV